MEINPNELETPKTKWLDCGGVRFLMKYVPPIQLDRWRKQMIARGIMRETRGGRIDSTPGREQEFYRAVAETFIENFDGNITGNPPYTADLMGKILAYHDLVWKVVQETIQEQADFFASNGNAPPQS